MNFTVRYKNLRSMRHIHPQIAYSRSGTLKVLGENL